MKKHLLLIALAIAGIVSNAQIVPRVFEDFRTAAGTQNLFVKTVQKTDASSNVYTAGATINGSGDYDIFITKVSPRGVQLWQKQIPGVTGGMDFAAGMLVTDTYVILTGGISTTTTTVETDIFTMKLAASTGSVSWTSYYSGSGGSFDAGKHVVLDASNNIYITGGGYNSSLNTDYITIKYSPTGTQSWVNVWDYLGYDDMAIKVVTSGSNLTITGAVTTATASTYKMATLTLAQSTGSLLATNVSTAITTSSVDIVSDLATDASGNIIIAGCNYISGQGNNFYVQKLAGATLISAWTYTWNGSSSLDDVAKAVYCDASANVLIAGYSTSATLGKELTLLQLNSSGVLQHSVTSGFSGDDEAADLVIDASNNTYVTGYKTNASANKDYYTAKYSTTLTKTWEVVTDGVGYNDNATNVTLDSLNNVIVAGQSETSPGVLRYLTMKYVQLDVTDPVDLNGEATNKNISFHKNSGQIQKDSLTKATDVLFYTHNLNPEIYIEKNSYNYVFRSIDTLVSTYDSTEKFHISFTSSSSTAKPYGYNPKTYPLNYFLGHVGEPIINVRGNDRLVTTNIYPKIDLHYYSNSKGLKYYFVVREGGDPRSITFNIAGATTTTITSNNLFIDGVLGDVTLKRPLAYMVNGAGVTTTLTSSSWTDLGGNNYGITTPTYTTSQSLIIVIETVPTSVTGGMAGNLEYSTYYGGNAADYFMDIKVAPNGDRAVTGYSAGGTFPTPNGLFQFFTPSSTYDAVLLKYTADDTLRWATYYGANGADLSNSVAFNAAGDIYIGGQTFSTDLLITNNSGETNQAYNGYQNNPGYGLKSDGFVAKFTGDGLTKPYARYFGGYKSDYINSIHIDGSNNLYVTGTTSSPDFPASNGHGSSSNVDDFDAFAGKINSGHVVQWLKYFGGDGNGAPSTSTTEYGMDIVTDNSGNVFICGETDENVSWPATNPTPGNANVLYDNSLSGNDGFIARFTPSGSVDYATYLGGTGSERVRRLVYKSTGELYFAGNANSTTGFPWKTKSGAYNNAIKYCNGPLFVGYMNSSLEHQWITYYGHGGSTRYFNNYGLSVDNTGIVYLSGQANSDTLIYGATTPSGVYTDNTYSNGDGFIAIFDANKQIYHAHFFGGSGAETISNSDLYGNYKLYVVGNTTSGSGSTTTANNFPIAYTATNASLIDSTFNGSNDGFITRFSLYPYNFVGVKEVTSIITDNLIIYPNPANNFVTLKLNAELKDALTLKVYNTVGQIVHEETITTNEKTIDCNNWATGMYIFVANTKTFTNSFKIIKN